MMLPELILIALLCSGQPWLCRVEEVSVCNDDSILVTQYIYQKLFERADDAREIGTAIRDDVKFLIKGDTFIIVKPGDAVSEYCID